MPQRGLKDLDAVVGLSAYGGVGEEQAMTMRQAGVNDGQQDTDWRGGDGGPSASMAVEGVQALPMGVSFTVRRRGLIRDVLAHDAAGKAVLICAPSHFGKTAVLIQVVEEVRTDPKRGAAVLIDAHDAQVDELLLQLDEVEETTSGQDRPLVAIDNLPVFEACAARMLVERLRGLRRLGCGVVASCLPSNRTLIKAFGDSIKIAPRALTVGPHEYAEWMRVFSLPVAIDVYGLTQGIPALVAALRGSLGGLAKPPRQYSSCVYEVCQSVMAEIEGEEGSLWSVAALMMLLGSGSLSDVGRCGPAITQRQVSALARDYPIFGIDPASQTFTCLTDAADALGRLRQDVVDKSPRLARRAVKTLMKLGRVDDAARLVEGQFSPAMALGAIRAYPVEFSLAGHARLVLRALDAPRGPSSHAGPRAIELVALYAASIIAGDLRQARFAAKRLERLSDDGGGERCAFAWARAEAIHSAWGGSDGTELPERDHGGDIASTDDACILLSLHVRLLHALVRHEDLEEPLAAEGLRDSVRLDQPRLLVEADRMIGEALMGGTLRLDERDELYAGICGELLDEGLTWVAGQMRLALATRRLLVGMPVADERAFSDAGTLYVRANNQEMQLLCTVLEGWQDLLHGEVINAGFRGRQVAGLAGEGLDFIFGWAKLLERVAQLRNTSLVTLREEAVAIDLAERGVDSLRAWRVALELSAARMDAELSAWYSMHRVSLLDPSMRLVARLAIDALGERADSVRRLLPRQLLVGYSLLAPEDAKVDRPFQVVAQPELDEEQVRINLFGGFRAERGGHVMVDELWKRKKASVLAARLVLAEGSFVPRDVLAGELWPGLAPERAKSNLYTTLSTLRGALGQRQMGVNYLVTQGEGVAINVEYISSDIMVFNALTRQVLLRRNGASAPQLIELCLKAEQVYVGPLYVPDRNTPRFFVNMRRALQAKFVDCMMRGVELAIDEENTGAAIWMVEAALRYEPRREDVVRAAMRVYDLDGRRREVEELFMRHGVYLREHGGGLPEPETRALYERIMQRKRRHGSVS